MFIFYIGIKLLERLKKKDHLVTPWRPVATLRQNM
jgi:hypothetical protein